MKGIMRKKLVALLSAAGLAGTATSAAGQVLKGSEPSNKTKAESKIKYNKAQQENRAAANSAAYKERKAGGEQKAAKDVVNEKIGPDRIVHKHIAGVKYEDAASKDAAKTAQRKAGGSQHENAATAGKIKLEKSAAESDASKKAATIKLTNANTAHGQATKKTNQASPGKKMDQASPK